MANLIQTQRNQFLSIAHVIEHSLNRPSSGIRKNRFYLVAFRKFDSIHFGEGC